jgi:hypothetical protein
MEAKTTDFSKGKEAPQAEVKDVGIPELLERVKEDLALLSQTMYTRDEKNNAYLTVDMRQALIDLILLISIIKEMEPYIELKSKLKDPVQ